MGVYCRALREPSCLRDRTLVWRSGPSQGGLAVVVSIDRIGRYTMTMRLLLIFVLFISLSACGFHLRGQLPIPDSVKVITVTSTENDLQRHMVDALSSSGATVVNSTADALAVLDLEKVDYERSVRTIDDRGKVNGYPLQYPVKFRLVTAEGEVLRDSRVFARRDFNFDPDLVLQAEIEEEALRQDMLTDLSQQILRQPATITASLSTSGQAGQASYL